MEAFQALARVGDWALPLPLVVRGQAIDEAALSAPPPGVFDGPPPRSRPLRLTQPITRGLNVRLAQVALSRPGHGHAVAADGLFGRQSERAVSELQRQVGLPPTGVIDDATYDRLLLSGAEDRRQHEAAAADVEQRAGDERGLFRQQPDDGAGHLLGRRARFIAIVSAIRARSSASWRTRVGHVGERHAGAQRVDADALARDLFGKPDREAVDRALGGGIGGTPARPPIVAAIEETLTMAPPAPPRAVDIRRTASRQHSIVPITLTASRRSSLDCSSSATGVVAPPRCRRC